MSQWDGGTDGSGMPPPPPPPPAPSDGAGQTWPRLPGAPEPIVDAGYDQPTSDGARAIGWFMLGASAVVFISAFLPWFEVLGISVNGIGGDDVGGVKDGVLTLVLAVPAIVLGILRVTGKAMLGSGITVLVVGALIALIAVVDMDDINDLPAASIGVGLWLTLLGAIVMVVSGVVGIARRR